jgi:hypothetical protein
MEMMIFALLGRRAGWILWDPHTLQNPANSMTRCHVEHVWEPTEGIKARHEDQQSPEIQPCKKW